MITKARLVQTIEDNMTSTEVELDGLVTFMAARGITQSGINTNKAQRVELQGMPKFHGVCGPMFDGDAIRYEDTQSYAALSV